MNIRCIVVDDSSIQRLSIVKMIEKHPNLELIAEYRNAIETKKGLMQHEVDLIFLDIEMPVINGFDLLDLIPSKPQIIFITGKAEYALKAFDYDATDYLHKPITNSRFNKAVTKAIEHHMFKHESSEQNYIFVKSNLKNVKINVNDIYWIEALGDYIKIITHKNVHIVLSTMKGFNEKIAKFNFLRIHKSYIVNLKKVNHFDSKCVIVNKKTLPLSRTKKGLLTEALSNL